MEVLKMTVKDFVDMFVDSGQVEITIYSFNKDRNLYKGWADDLPYHLEGEYIESIDSPDGVDRITVNII